MLKLTRYRGRVLGLVLGIVLTAVVLLAVAGCGHGHGGY
jgi:hypothetical protein